jgi:hypothetical protein
MGLSLCRNGMSQALVVVGAVETPRRRSNRENCCRVAYELLMLSTISYPNV